MSKNQEATLSHMERNKNVDYRRSAVLFEVRVAGLSVGVTNQQKEAVGWYNEATSQSHHSQVIEMNNTTSKKRIVMDNRKVVRPVLKPASKTGKRKVEAKITESGHVVDHKKGERK